MHLGFTLWFFSLLEGKVSKVQQKSQKTFKARLEWLLRSLV